MRRFLLLVTASVALAQDASLVLRTFVGYNATANTVQLTPEKKAEVQALGKQAMMASAQGKFGDALRLLHKGTAAMRGIEWTPAMSLAASLSASVDHAVREPGQPVELRLKRLYPADEGAPNTPKGTIRMRPAIGKSDPISLGDLTAESITLKLPDLSPGSYRLEVLVEPLPQPKTVELAIAPGVAERAAKLSARTARSKSAPGSALWTLQYIAALFERADRAEISPLINFSKELTDGEELATALEAGRDPLSARTGDQRRAYLSKEDTTLQPYRLYVPASYKGDTVTPLVVALHGMGGDENSLFDRYGSRTLQDQADKFGWIVVAPKGRDSASMYRGAAEKDVIDVIARVRESLKVDPDRIYVTGHSMGGFGSWSIAMNYPDLFAALGPVAGGGNPAAMEKIARIPQIVVHGDNDKTVPVESSRSMVAAAKKLGTDVEYVEVKGGGHNEVFMPAMPRVFEFFSTKKKGEAAAR